MLTARAPPTLTLRSLLTDWGDEELSAIIDPDARDFKFVLWINAFSVKDMQASRPQSQKEALA